MPRSPTPTAYVTPAGTTAVTVPTAYMEADDLLRQKRSLSPRRNAFAYPVLNNEHRLQETHARRGHGIQRTERETGNDHVHDLSGLRRAPDPPVLCPLAPSDCVWAPTPPGKEYTFTTEYTLTTTGEYKRNIYLGELPSGFESSKSYSRNDLWLG